MVLGGGGNVGMGSAEALLGPGGAAPIPHPVPLWDSHPGALCPVRLSPALKSSCTHHSHTWHGVSSRSPSLSCV